MLADVRLLSDTLEARSATPVAVGSAASSTIYKLHALAHQLRLESRSWQHLTSMLSSIVASTTDGGVEAGLGRYPRFRLQSLFPWLLQDEPTGEFDFVDEGCQPPAQPEFQFGDGDELVDPPAPVVDEAGDDGQDPGARWTTPGTSSWILLGGCKFQACIIAYTTP